MDPQTDATNGGTEATAAAETSQVDGAQAQNAEDTAAQQAGAETAGQADEAGEAPKKKPWWEKRFDELTAQKYEAAREAAYWKGIAEGGGRSQQPAQQPVPDGPPREDQFSSYDEYEQALIDYKVDQRLAQAEQRQRQQTAARTYEERATKVRAEKPDYDRVVGDPTLPITPLMAEVIRESEVGPQVAYHLGVNRSEAARIATLPPHLQAKELGKLEAALAASPTPPPAKPIPPSPPQTVGGVSAGISKAPEDMSMSEYITWRRSQQ